MPKNELPYWLLNTIFTGREGEEGGDEGEGNEGDNSGDDSSEGTEGESGEGDSSSDKPDDENVDGLKSALEKERSKAKRLERENLRLKRKKDQAKTEETEEEKANLAEASEKLKKSQEKVSKLAEKLRNDARDAAILKAATDAGFIDPTDALTDDIRRAVEVDQDDEDPSDIEVDTTSATAAVKKLATSKKHLIGKPNNGAPSGGRFSSRDRTDDNAGDNLGELYPSLQ